VGGGLLAAALVVSMCLFVRRRQRAAELPQPSQLQLQKLQQHGSASSVMLSPPCCGWQIGEGHAFALFLSHYKKEAGSDARYLHDVLSRMLGCSCFLDSESLVTLEHLMSGGLRKSDVVVVLATGDYLTRPWCLLEVWEAHRTSTPCVLIEVAGRGFDAAEARAFLKNIEVNLPDWAMAEVKNNLPAGTSVKHFRRACLAALHLDGDGALPAVIKFQPWASDHQMLAACIDLVDACAEAAGRAKLAWGDNKMRVEDKGPNSSRRESMGRSNSGSTVPPMTKKWRLTSHATALSRAARRNGSNAEAKGAAYAAFVSHYRAEAGCTARFLQVALARRLGRPVFLDASDAVSIDTIISDGVVNSEMLVLILTERVLTRPWVLLEVYEAVRRKIPLVPVFIEGAGYDYGRAAEFLKDLETNLEAANPGAVNVIEGQLRKRGSDGLSFAYLAEALQTAIPLTIAVQYSPDGSDNHIEAALSDMIDRAQKQRMLRTRLSVGSSLRLSANAFRASEMARATSEISSPQRFPVPNVSSSVQGSTLESSGNQPIQISVEHV